mmetsp:Transcript_42952/g.67150  ORF Transcript_42952/g.67150 Transcript_42952/m.67150 type:complete len:203 (+) Transcript_42952:178-786(+)
MPVSCLCFYSCISSVITKQVSEPCNKPHYQAFNRSKDGGQGPQQNPQLLHHCTHRPREKHPCRQASRDHRHGAVPGHAVPAVGLHGHRARARDHHQAAGGAHGVHGAGRRELRAEPDRHAGARGLHLRGLALAGRLRGRHPGGGCQPGRGGADPGQRVPGAGKRPGGDPGAEQDRPAGGGPGPGLRGGGADRGPGLHGRGAL